MSTTITGAMAATAGKTPGATAEGDTGLRAEAADTARNSRAV